MDDMNSEEHRIAASAPPAPLISALRRVLRPLIRLMLAYGVTFPFLSNLLKSIYVEVASDEFRLEGRRQTDSRISLLTGVHRKDVKRLCHEERPKEAVPTAISLGAQLVARWMSSPQYLDEGGRPRALPRLASVGGELSFEGLVSSVSKDIRSRAVLDEWLRMGVARLDDEERVTLNTGAFVPQKGFDEKAFYFGQNIHDHLAAGVHNLLGGQPPFLERSVYYDELTPESVQELAELAKSLGMEALQTVNRRALELQQQDDGKRNAGMRMNFGTYYFSVVCNTTPDENPANGD
jgi:hypothetical protein